MILLAAPRCSVAASTIPFVLEDAGRKCCHLLGLSFVPTACVLLPTLNLSSLGLGLVSFTSLTVYETVFSPSLHLSIFSSFFCLAWGSSNLCISLASTVYEYAKVDKPNIFLYKIVH